MFPPAPNAVRSCRWGRYWTVLCAAVVLALSSSAQVMDQGRLLTHPAFHRIPFAKTSRGIHDTVELGGQRYRFVFDTGAPLCISEAIQAANHYPVIYQADLGDANAKHSSTVIVLVDSIRWGTMLFLGVPAVVIDVAHSPLAREHVAGLVGSNMVRHLVVRFDAQNKEVLLADDPARLGWDTTQARPGRLDVQDNFLFACTIGDCFTDSALFDSGMRDLYLMNRTVADSNLTRCPDSTFRIHAGHGRRSQGLLGKDDGGKPLLLYVSAFRFGSTDLGELTISTNRTRSAMGRELLSHGTLTLNYPAAAYRFDPRATAPLRGAP